MARQREAPVSRGARERSAPEYSLEAGAGPSDEPSRPVYARHDTPESSRGPFQKTVPEKIEKQAVAREGAGGPSCSRHHSRVPGAHAVRLRRFHAPLTSICSPPTTRAQAPSLPPTQNRTSSARTTRRTHFPPSSTCSAGPQANRSQHPAHKSANKIRSLLTRHPPPRASGQARSTTRPRCLPTSSTPNRQGGPSRARRTGACPSPPSRRRRTTRATRGATGRASAPAALRTV